MSNQGHGHVVPRSDGIKARCGGPAICTVCALEKARREVTEITIKGGELNLSDLRNQPGDVIYAQDVNYTRLRDELETGKQIVRALIQRHFVDGDNSDLQLRDACDWAGVPFPGEDE